MQIFRSVAKRGAESIERREFRRDFYGGNIFLGGDKRLPLPKIIERA